jgi:uncharacterized protein with PIN domain
LEEFLYDERRSAAPMVIDLSALIAILSDEPEADISVDAIAEAELRLMSAANLREAAIVVDDQGGRRLVADWIATSNRHGSSSHQ